MTATARGILPCDPFVLIRLDNRLVALAEIGPVFPNSGHCGKGGSTGAIQAKSSPGRSPYAGDCQKRRMSQTVADVLRRGLPARPARCRDSLLDTGHFALETHHSEIASLMRDFLQRHGI